MDREQIEQEYYMIIREIEDILHDEFISNSNLKENDNMNYIKDKILNKKFIFELSNRGYVDDIKEIRYVKIPEINSQKNLFKLIITQNIKKFMEKPNDTTISIKLPNDLVGIIYKNHNDLYYLLKENINQHNNELSIRVIIKKNNIYIHKIIKNIKHVNAVNGHFCKGNLSQSINTRYKLTNILDLTDILNLILIQNETSGYSVINPSENDIYKLENNNESILSSIANHYYYRMKAGLENE